MKHSLNDKPKISEQWRLRNDRRNILAYKCSVEKDVFKVLSPAMASIIPLLDGTNTWQDLKEALYAIYNLDGPLRELWSGRFDDMFDDLTAANGFISLENGASPSLNNKYEYFTTDLANYHYPAWRLEKPLSVKIAFTNRCVCNCIYCYAERKNCAEADVRQWKKIFDELYENEIFLVDIGGSDIFSRTDAFSLLKEMAARDFTFFVSTKKQISGDEARRLAEMGIGRFDIPEYLIRPFQISIDSTDEKTASYLVSRKNYFQQSAESVKNLVKSGIIPRIKGVLTAFNSDAIDGIVKYFSGLGVREFTFVQYSRSHFRHDDQLFLSPEQKKRISETASRVKTDFPSLTVNIQEDTYLSGPRNLTWEDWQNRNVCSGGRSNFIIQPNGDVTLCEQTPHNDEFVVGNVFREGILRVWNSKTLHDFLYPDRSKFRGTACYDCPGYEECHQLKGYCYRDVLSSYGTIYDAQPECPRQKKTPVREI